MGPVVVDQGRRQLRHRVGRSACIHRSYLRLTVSPGHFAGIALGGGPLAEVRPHQWRSPDEGRPYRTHDGREKDIAMVWFILVVDSDSLRLHLEVGRSAFQKFAALIDLYSIEVYGQPSDEVLSLLEDKAAMLGDGSRVEVHERQAGFLRAQVHTS